MKIVLTEEQKIKMFEYGIPEYMHGSLIRYFEKHYQPGHFLTAVLENDLMEAIARADETNVQCLKAYAMWLYNQAPGRASGAWGTPEAVAKWIANEEEEIEV